MDEKDNVRFRRDNCSVTKNVIDESSGKATYGVYYFSQFNVSLHSLKIAQTCLGQV